MSTQKTEMFKGAQGANVSGGTYNNVEQGVWNAHDSAADPESIKKKQAAFAAAAASGPSTVATIFEGSSGTIQGQGTYNNSKGAFDSAASGATKK
jgi:hypothetical protein